MSNKVPLWGGGIAFAALAGLATTQGCGGSGGSNDVALCEQLLTKVYACLADAGLSGAAPTSAQIMQMCTSPDAGANASQCKNASAVRANLNMCLSMNNCTAFETCIQAVPCQSASTGAGGSTGSCGAACTKADACCDALAQAAGTCMYTSTCNAQTSDVGRQSYVGVCQSFVQSTVQTLGTTAPAACQ